VQLCELEVVWPLHRWHYLSPALADEGLVMHTEQAATDDPTMASVDVLPGRDLAARALLADLPCAWEAK